MVGGISFCVIKTEIVLCFAKEYFTCGGDGDDHGVGGKDEDDHGGGN